MAAIVSVINLKGGVGKSTLTMILAEFLAFNYAKDVLLIDMDAQANLSYCMVPEDSIQTQERDERTVYHLFQRAIRGRTIDIADMLTRPPLVVSNIARSGMRTPNTKIDMVISTPSVAQLDEDLLSLWEDGKPMPKGLRNSLTEALGPVEQKYDYILIDCPPGLSLFSSAALIASHYFISPIIPEPLSLQGVQLVLNRARELKELTTDGRLEFRGVVLNVVKHYRNTHQRVSDSLYTTQRSLYSPFRFWLPDNERIRKLGEFDPDVEGQWAQGVGQKFGTVHNKYALSYRLSNPKTGPLNCADVEGPQYTLDGRIASLVEEFMERCPPL